MVGFWIFGTQRRPVRTGRDLRTGKSVEVAASTVPTFRSGKTLRGAVKAGKGSCSEGGRCTRTAEGVDARNVEIDRLRNDDGLSARCLNTR